MKIGTRTLLFGVHQVFWHPLTVLLAYRKLYRRWPSWPQLIAIFCHDLGYFGKPDLDGVEGRLHPYSGARLTERIVTFLANEEKGGFAYWFSLYHSRELAKLEGVSVTALYAADKYSIFYDPKWFYLLRSKLSGEIAEFKQRAIGSGKLPANATDGEWFDYYRADVLGRPEIKSLL